MDDVLGSSPESMTGARPRHGRTSGQMQSLLGEFKGLYEGRLKRLDDAESAGEETGKV